MQLALAELESERREQEVSEKEVVGYTRREKKDGAAQPRIPEHLEVIRADSTLAEAINYANGLN